MKKIDAAVDEAVDEDSVSNHSRECQRMEWPAIIYESGRRCLPSWLQPSEARRPGIASSALSRQIASDHRSPREESPLDHPPN